MMELMCYFYVEIVRLSHVKCIKLCLRDEIKNEQSVWSLGSFCLNSFDCSE